MFPSAFLGQSDGVLCGIVQKVTLLSRDLSGKS